MLNMNIKRSRLNVRSENRAEARCTSSGSAYMIVRYKHLKDKESAGKPGSVEDNHSSVMPVAGHL